jgi:predicted amidophosphoribosyltransferase
VPTTREVLSSLVDLVVPRVCALCGELDVRVCAACDALIRESGESRRVLNMPGGFVEVHSAVVAGPEVLRLITAFKDGGHSDLAGYLGGVLRVARRRGELPAGARATAAPRSGDDVVVTVPQSRRAYRRRGWSPVRSLARAAGYRPQEVLEVDSRHIDQTTLTRDLRWHNVSQTVRVLPDRAHTIRGRHVTVIDDVITTGATMAEVARALTVAGAISVQGVTIASVERRTRQTHR